MSQGETLGGVAVRQAEGRTQILALSGEIDLALEGVIESTFSSSYDPSDPAKLWAMDLRGVSSLDCGAIKELMRVVRRVIEDGGRVTMVCLYGSCPQRMLSTFGANQAVPICPTIEVAVAYLNRSTE